MTKARARESAKKRSTENKKRIVDRNERDQNLDPENFGPRSRAAHRSDMNANVKNFGMARRWAARAK